MPEFSNMQEADKSCKEKGYYRTIAFVNKRRIKSLMENAEINLNTAELIKKSINEQDARWMNVYIEHYDALRIYVEAYLFFDKIIISNHLCLFTYLCVKYPDFEFDWNFCENIRKKRNGANYYGEKITYENWKEDEARFNLYISILKKEINKKLVTSEESDGGEESNN